MLTFPTRRIERLFVFHCEVCRLLLNCRITFPFEAKMSRRRLVHSKMSRTPIVQGIDERGRKFSYRPPGTPDEYRGRCNIIPRGKRTWRWATLDGKKVRVDAKTKKVVNG